MRDIGSQENFDFVTNTIFQRNIKGSHLLANFDLKPCWSILWDYKILGIFLNQLHDFKPNEQKPTRIIVKNGKNERYFKFVHNDLGKDFSFTISIKEEENFEINVVASRALLDLKQLFAEKQESTYTFSYKISFTNLSPSSIAILNSETLAFFQASDFSPCFIYFARVIRKNLINNSFTNFIFQFVKIFLKRSISSTIFDLKQLAYQTKGYLKILTTKTNLNGLFKINNNEESYILRGAYLSPYAQSIFKDNSELIDGVLLDGTFKILKHYVTCIITVVSHNTSIPIGFTFSPVEDTKLYDSVFETILEILNVDLSKYIIESDKGSSLKASCDSRFVTHLKCLKHLQTNLRKKKYGFEASELVSSRCQKDYVTLTRRYNSIFKDIKSKKEITILNNTLQKIGIQFINDELTITEPDLWNSVSMIMRSQHRMPSTTNSIESQHGHLNEATPRNNMFYNSIFRLIMFINTSIRQFNEKFQHNVQRLFRDIKKKMKNNPNIGSECVFYDTTLDRCECGVTILYTSMYRCDIPCSHRLFLGAVFPQIEEIKLKLNKQFDELIKDIIEDNEPREQIDHDRIKEIIVKNIKKFSHSKSKEKIIQYVNENYVPKYDEFALGYPIEFFDVISKGSIFFTSKR